MRAQLTMMPKCTLRQRGNPPDIMLAKPFDGGSATFGNGSRSLAARRSPWKSFTPMRFSSARLRSLPGRMKLSKPAISCASGLIATFTPVSRITRPQRQSISSRAGWALISIATSHRAASRTIASTSQSWNLYQKLVG